MRLMALVFVSLAAAGFARGQDFLAVQQAEEFVVSEPDSEVLTIDGIVRQIFEVEKPWQLVNPAAPADYGTGEANVSEDEAGGTPVQARGVTVLGFEW
jgi:hypothetical protein